MNNIQVGNGKGIGTAGNDAGGVATFYPPRERSPWWVGALLAIFTVAAILPLFLSIYYGAVQANLEFTLDDDGLTVGYGVGHIDIPAPDIADVGYVSDPPRMLRVGGAGLPNLQMGWYRWPEFGRVYRLTTAAQHVVYVDTKAITTAARPETRYVFNPEDAEVFAALLQSIAGLPSDATADSGGGSSLPRTFEPSARGGFFSSPFMVVLGVITLGVGIGLPVFAVRGRNNMRYRIDRDGIAVHHLGWKEYPWSTVRDVRIVKQVPRMWRLMGVSMPGYYAGTFNAGKEWGTISVYGTRIKAPLVLIETEETKILVSPADGNAFLARIEQFRNGSD